MINRGSYVIKCVTNLYILKNNLKDFVKFNVIYIETYYSSSQCSFFDHNYYLSAAQNLGKLK